MPKSARPRQPSKADLDRLQYQTTRDTVDEFAIRGYTATGPLAKLDNNQYYAPDMKLSYPVDMGQNNKLYPHFIKFNINQPAKSRYQSKFDSDQILSAADLNRETFNQLGGSALGSPEAVTAGLAAGTISGLTELATDLSAQANKGADASIKGNANRGVRTGTSAAAVGALSGLVAAAVVAQVDLTRKTKRLLQTINLYMPDQVVMQTQNKYGEVSLTAALGAAGLGANLGKSLTGNLEGVLNDITSGGGAAAGAKVGKAIGGVGAAGAEAAAGLLGAAGRKLGVVGEGIENVLLQSYGYAQNPQIEVLFDTTDMRQFEFVFNFLPRNKAESEAVLRIIRMFRFHAAPEIPETFAGRYYIPPSEFDIQYMFIDDNGQIYENPALHKFSTCVLESIDVNYVGATGQFVTFSDGRPVNIELRLRFKEIEVIHKELIRNGY